MKEVRNNASRKVAKGLRLLSALVLTLQISPAAAQKPTDILSQRLQSSSVAAQDSATAKRDHQHDFDFEFGTWKAHLKRMLHPLSGSHTWVRLSGTSIVRKVWDGRANLGEIELGNERSHIEGLSLRLYNPQSHQWSLYFANSKAGSLGTPTVGQFNNGRGEFFDNEDFQGKPVRVRFVFTNITPHSFRYEQSFSPDGGKTWEVNWIASFTR